MASFGALCLDGLADCSPYFAVCGSCQHRPPLSRLSAICCCDLVNKSCSKKAPCVAAVVVVVRAVERDRKLRFKYIYCQGLQRWNYFLRKLSVFSFLREIQVLNQYQMSALQIFTMVWALVLGISRHTQLLFIKSLVASVEVFVTWKLSENDKSWGSRELNQVSPDST